MVNISVRVHTHTHNASDEKGKVSTRTREKISRTIFSPRNFNMKGREIRQLLGERQKE